MEGLFYLLVFGFGAIVGSFLNVVVYRYNTGLSIVRGRSRCLSCSKVLSWFELVPVLSFFVFNRRCRNCLTKISWQYPLVEILTGFVFLLIFNFQFPIFNFQFPIFNFFSIFKLFYDWTIFSLLIAIAVYDLRHKIIPDGLVYTFIILSFFRAFGYATIEPVAGGAFGAAGLSKILTNPISIGLLFFLAFALFWLISEGRWMGLGDAKLALGIGWFLPFPQNLSAVISAFWLGAITGIFLLFLNRKKITLKSEIPFAPFLVLGTFIAYFYHLNLLWL